MFFLHTLKTTSESVTIFVLVMEYNLEKSRRERKGQLRLPTFLLTIFFFLSWYSKVHFLLFCFSLETFFQHSFRVGLLATNSLFFFIVRMSWFPLRSWRIFSLDIRFWIDSSFFSASENCCVTSFWPPWLLMRTSLSFELFPPYRRGVTSLSLLSRIFCSIFSFRSLTVLYLGVDFIEFIFFGVLLSFTNL